MMLANFPDMTPMVFMLFFFAYVVLFVVFSKQKDRALAMAFGAVCIGLSLFLLYHMIFPR